MKKFFSIKERGDAESHAHLSTVETSDAESPSRPSTVETGAAALPARLSTVETSAAESSAHLSTVDSGAVSAGGNHHHHLGAGSEGGSAGGAPINFDLPAEKMYIGVDEIDDEAAAFADFDDRLDFFDDDIDNPIDFFDEDDDSAFFADEPLINTSTTVEPPKKIRAVGWGFGSLAPLVEHDPVDITFEPTINDFNDVKSVQCMISTIAPSGTPDQFPDRAALGRIYKFLRSQSKGAALRPFNICKLAADFKRSTVAFDDQKLNSICTFDGAVRVLSEIGLIRFDADKKNFFMPVPNKTFDLNRSRLFKLNAKGDVNER